MKVGDYVRTKYLGGSIEKIIEIIPKERTVDEKERYLTDISSTFSVMIEEQDIIKSSPNIIDLIEVGDYVNGCYVTNRQASHNEGIAIIPKRIGIIKCNAYFNQGNYNDYDFKWIEEKDIKSIVTKEQFEAMEYKCE